MCVNVALCDCVNVALCDFCALMLRYGTVDQLTSFLLTILNLTTGILKSRHILPNTNLYVKHDVPEILMITSVWNGTRESISTQTTTVSMTSGFLTLCRGLLDLLLARYTVICICLFSTTIIRRGMMFSITDMY